MIETCKREVYRRDLSGRIREKCSTHNAKCGECFPTMNEDNLVKTTTCEYAKYKNRTDDSISEKCITHDKTWGSCEIPETKAKLLKE